MHEKLNCIYLDGNKIADLSFADTLSSCPLLSTLTLGRNPITKAPKYRLVVAALIPTLKFLDGVIVDSTTDTDTKVTNGMILEVAHAMQV